MFTSHYSENNSTFTDGDITAEGHQVFTCMLQEPVTHMREIHWDSCHSRCGNFPHVLVTITRVTKCSEAFESRAIL